jgi:hypothetical protein
MNKEEVDKSEEDDDDKKEPVVPHGDIHRSASLPSKF